MATQQQRQEARELRHRLAEANAMPSSLRAPLVRVQYDEELPGTAEDVLEFARKVLSESASAQSSKRLRGEGVNP